MASKHVLQSMRRIVLVLAGLLVVLPSQATTYHVAIDTTSLGAVTLGAAFDLVDGGTPANNVMISNFSTDGSLGAVSISGSITGNLTSTVILDDSAFFSELYQPISSPTGIAFDFAPTANGPDSGSLPDTFSFFLIDDLTNLPLFDTNDPTGAGSLFIFEIDGSATGSLSVYGPTDTDVLVSWSVAPVILNPVPEPGSLALMTAGLASALLARCKRA